jgi:RNA-directed DNA polymerase
MTAAIPAGETSPDGDATGASFHDVTDWHTMNWQKVNHTVRRLQARIVKATKEKRWGKVKARPRLLTHSFSGKALAVRRVTENQGKNTPGVDKVTWNTPRKKINAISSLRQRDYHPQPLRRIYIPKKNGATRILQTVSTRGTRSSVFHLENADN